MDLLEDLDCKLYKIASFEITDLKLINYIASKKKPIIISTGMASTREIKLALKEIRKYHNKIVILHWVYLCVCLCLFCFCFVYKESQIWKNKRNEKHEIKTSRKRAKIINYFGRKILCSDPNNIRRQLKVFKFMVFAFLKRH